MRSDRKSEGSSFKTDWPDARAGALRTTGFSTALACSAELAGFTLALVGVVRANAGLALPARGACVGKADVPGSEDDTVGNTTTGAADDTPGVDSKDTEGSVSGGKSASNT